MTPGLDGTMPSALDDEIRGAWNNLKGTEYHLIYALWLLFQNRTARVAFYKGYCTRLTSAFLTEHGVPNTRIYKLHEKGTPTIVDYDAAGKHIDVVPNGVLDTHHDFDVANQVLGPVDDVANNVISDTSRFAADADNCWALRCTNSSIVLTWKLRASLATAQTQTYTVTWHNANPTAMCVPP